MNRMQYTREQIVKDGERLDDLQCKGYEIIQNGKNFCFGMDAVLLADFTNVRKGQRVLDLGTGTGIIPILLAAKTQGLHFTGLEIQPESADMAKRSVLWNQLEEKIAIVEGDIKEASGLFPAASFDVVTSNPPYMIAQNGLTNEYEPKNIARHEILCNLEDVVAAAAKLVKPGGSFFIIHKPFRTAEIFNTLMKYRMEPKRMRFVHPYVDKEPSMVMIEATRGGKSMIKIEPPLIVYAKKQQYSEEIYRIYGKETS